MNRERTVGLPMQPHVESQPISEYEFRVRFGYAIRSAMQFRGISARDLSTLVGSSENTVGRWINGRNIPNAFCVGKLANALSVDSELFTNPPTIPAYPLEDYLIENRDLQTQS